MREKEDRHRQRRVLIDTWWNVNYFVELGISSRLSF